MGPDHEPNLPTSAGTQFLRGLSFSAGAARPDLHLSDVAHPPDTCAGLGSQLRALGTALSEWLHRRAVALHARRHSSHNGIKAIVTARPIACTAHAASRFTHPAGPLA
jgi:hypothetical protein